MTTVFDRLSDELEHVGQRVRSALEISRLHAERAGLVALKGRAAYQLGLAVHARERGEEPAAGSYERLLSRMDDLTHQIAEIDRRIAEEDCREPEVHETPAPAAAEAEAAWGGESETA